MVYVLDGGALLQTLPWPNQTTYTNMSNPYVQYVHRHYNHAVVVFDGYANGPSTKDETHQRRTSSHIIMLGSILGHNMQLTMKKTSFLANTKKQNFLYFFGSELDITGKVQHSASDADYNIVSLLSDSQQDHQHPRPTRRKP